jgi:hypothetical protein
LQHQGDRPVRHGRPSLLSPDEQAVPERQGILSSLDGMRTPAAAAQRPRSRARGLAWGGAAVGAIVAGAALFMSGADRQAPPATVAAVAAVPAVHDAPAAMPAPAVLRDEPAPPAENPLADMAPPAAHGAEVRGKPRTAQAGRKEAQAARRTAREHTHDKPHDKPHDKLQDRPPPKRPKARRATEADSDVVLLAALVSHIEPKKGKATPAEQLEACRRYNAAGEAQCRARVCADAGRKEAACRRVQAARTDPEI